MIELDIKPYCHECPRFKPIANTAIYKNGLPVVQHVMCENHLECANIEAYLRTKIQKEMEK